jgi:hypothetical protein
MASLRPSVSGLLLCAQLLLPCTGSSIIPRHETLSFKGPLAVEANGIANIHVSYNLPLTGDLSIHYGECDVPASHPKSSHHHQIGETVVGNHPFAKRHVDWEDQRPERFLWLVPESALDGGCLFAYSGADLVGRSEVVTVVKKRSRRGIVLNGVADAEGPWFDGVEYLSAKDTNTTFVAQAKTKSIGILGAGMSGLMSAVSFSHHFGFSIVANPN